MQAIIIKTGAKKIAGAWFAKVAKVEKINIKNDLKAYYKALGCQTIDIQVRTIEGKPFDFICDDEAFMYETPAVVSVRSKTDSRYNLVNTLIVCKSEEGETIGLTDEECEFVLAHFKNNAIEID